jgi:hypothetical protein
LAESAQALQEIEDAGGAQVVKNLIAAFFAGDNTDIAQFAQVA